MKNTLKTFFALMICTVLISSCKKDDPKTKKDFLQDNSCWKTTRIDLKDDATGLYVDVSSVLLADECFRDDCYNFSSDGKYLVTEGATKCDPSDPTEIDNGTWSLSADENTLTITSDGIVNEFKVESLTASKLVVTGEEDGITGRFTYE